MENLSFEKRLREMGFVQPREETSRGKSHQCNKYLKWKCKEDGVRLFLAVGQTNTEGSI